MERTEAEKQTILEKIIYVVDECWGKAVEPKLSDDIASYEDPSCDRVDFVYFDMPTKGLQPSVNVVVETARRISKTITGWHIVVHFSGWRCWIGVEQDSTEERRAS